LPTKIICDKTQHSSSFFAQASKLCDTFNHSFDYLIKLYDIYLNTFTKIRFSVYLLKIYARKDSKNYHSSQTSERICIIYVIYRYSIYPAVYFPFPQPATNTYLRHVLSCRSSKKKAGKIQSQTLRTK